nr:hypothetical protein [uncultured Acetatifactor sp.]
MSENTNTNTQQQTTPTPEAEGGKLFTQQQVNEIVRERLARERAKAEPTAIDERETALKAREARLDCRDYLEELSKGGKAASSVLGLLDILDTTDSEKFKQTVSALLELGAFNPQLEPLKIHPVDMRGGASPDDLIAAAFKPKS